MLKKDKRRGLKVTHSLSFPDYLHYVAGLGTVGHVKMIGLQVLINLRRVEANSVCMDKKGKGERCT